MSDRMGRGIVPAGFADLLTKPPHDIRKATDCHCVPGSCDCTEARVHAAELTALFNLQWKADMRAIKRWQVANPGNALVWPDRADMVVWLMGQLDSLTEIVKRHTHWRMWAMTRFAGPSPEDDCQLCRALVAAGVLALDQIGAGTRGALEQEVKS